MSSINIFELESVQDLNEQEVASVIGGKKKGLKVKVKVKANIVKDNDRTQQGQASINAGNNGFVFNGSGGGDGQFLSIGDTNGIYE